MSVRRLEGKAVERVWGSCNLPGWAPQPGGPADTPIGEIWFEDEADAASGLLVKYLFTSDRLSIQVHPDDAAARARGLPHGKDEFWLVVEAEPDAVIGLGLNRRVSREALRGAALDGSIETLVDWRPVATGQTFYSPAGTIHAIGGGLTLLEIQQDADVTYRLYDYGRPRDLHLDDGLAVACPEPFAGPEAATTIEPGRDLLARGGAFVVERWRGPWRGIVRPAKRKLVVVATAAGARLGGSDAAKGQVVTISGEDEVELTDGAELFVAYCGSEPIRDLRG